MPPLKRRPLQIESLEVRANPANLLVTALADVVNPLDDATIFTLREAVNFANSNPGPDAIEFDPALFSVAPPTNLGTLSELALTDTSGATSITGPGANLLAINAALNHRVFSVAANVVASMRGFSIQNGRADFGAGIHNSGILELDEMVLQGNNSTADGAGIYNRGRVQITGSSLVANSATGSGGGIGAYFSSQTIIRNSTISANTAQNYGGGIDINGANVTVYSSTIVRNRAQITNSGLGNGGGISNFGTATLVNTIVAGNTEGTAFVDSDITNNPMSSSSLNNIIGDSATSGGLVHNANGNIVGFNGTGTRFYGSIVETFLTTEWKTPVHRLINNSPAIDAGINSQLFLDVVTDQRGMARISGTKVDIGAVEKTIVAGPYVVDASDDSIDGDYSLGKLSLREAVVLANDHFGPDTINFAGTISKVTLAFDELFLEDDETTTINGEGVTIERSTDPLTREFRLLNIGPGADVVLNGLTLQNGDVRIIGAVGGGILNFGTLAADRLTVTNNQSITGGGIYNQGELLLKSSTVDGNHALANGGGIANRNELLLINSTISGNSSDFDGGGIHNTGALKLTNSTIANNSLSVPTALGGGIYADGNETLHNSIIAGNFNSATSTPDDINHALSFIMIDEGIANLIGDPTTAGGLLHGVLGNIIGQADPGGRVLLPLNQILQPLATNGWSLKTHALVANSPAIDTAESSLAVDDLTNVLTQDQRGYARLVNAAVDIGAVESGEDPADVNRDGIIDIQDILATIFVFNLYLDQLPISSSILPPDPPFVDATLDGVFDISDILRVIFRFNQVLASPEGEAAEPGTSTAPSTEVTAAVDAVFSNDLSVWLAGEADAFNRRRRG